MCRPVTLTCPVHAAGQDPKGLKVVDPQGPPAARIAVRPILRRRRRAEAHLAVQSGRSAIALVDAEGVVRGYYRSAETEQMERLIADTRRLAANS